MKEKELNKLSKGELLELLLYLRKECDKLTKENEKLLKKLEDKKSLTERLDSIERQVAALNGVKNVTHRAEAEAEYDG